MFGYEGYPPEGIGYIMSRAMKELLEAMSTPVPLSPNAVGDGTGVHLMGEELETYRELHEEKMREGPPCPRDMQLHWGIRRASFSREMTEELESQPMREFDTDYSWGFHPDGDHSANIFRANVCDMTLRLKADFSDKFHGDPTNDVRLKADTKRDMTYPSQGRADLVAVE